MHRQGPGLVVNERSPPSPSGRRGVQRTSTNDEAMLLLQHRQRAAIDLNYMLQQIMGDSKVATTYQAFRVRYLRALGKLRPDEYEEKELMTNEQVIRDYLRELRQKGQKRKEQCSRLQSLWVLYETLASDKPSALNAEDSKIEEEMDEFERELFEEWHDFAEEVIARAKFDGNEDDPDIAEWHLELKEIRKDLKYIERRNEERNEMRQRDLNRVRDMLRLRRGEDESERNDDDDSSDEQSQRSLKSLRTEKTSKTSVTTKSKKKKSKKEKKYDKDDSERGDDDAISQSHKSKKSKDKKSHKKNGKKKDKTKKKSSDRSGHGAHDSLLEEVFPPHIAQALREGRKVEPESKECVTIFFSDIVGFTNISAKLSPLKVSDMLDRLYQKFDALSHQHAVFKVETIGDSWMGVTNLNKAQSDHAVRIAQFALDALKASQETWVDEEDHSLGKLNLRVGFHTGPVVASVVGSRNPRYCLFGDTVNTSSRMESHSLPGRIHCSEASAALLRDNDVGISLVSRGNVEVKGKGLMQTYFVRDDSMPEDLGKLSPMPPSPQRISRVFNKELSFRSSRNASQPTRQRSMSGDKTIDDLLIEIEEE